MCWQCMCGVCQCVGCEVCEKVGIGYVFGCKVEQVDVFDVVDVVVCVFCECVVLVFQCGECLLDYVQMDFCMWQWCVGVQDYFDVFDVVVVCDDFF